MSLSEWTGWLIILWVLGGILWDILVDSEVGTGPQTNEQRLARAVAWPVFLFMAVFKAVKDN